ncbi:carboxypeptidase-like regulatory domain-containing protein [Microbacter margulisiae]|uniref:Carboxypeptidase-like regulatory domain-containing protein n=1 Tax=Microbacter margulisiae TaxID=1350067 RepID=A0A7W5DSI9_9PORP|nr:carboxypeptidase-like regulatory domain-containing protein [Microbacter margulisiae]MBB3188276.1 hypothetical protein [Microbacter margulisiae]
MNYSSVLRLLMIWCLILMPLFGIAQNEQVIVGQIIDGTTLHPVANATIRFSKTLIVAHSNSEGYFFLRSDGSHTKVDFSAQGYASRHLRIKPNRSAVINIKLRPLKVSELPLEVCRQDTVAKSIILQVIQHKPVNNPEVGFHPSTESERLKAYVYHLPPDWIQGTQVADAATYSIDSLCSLPLFTEDRIYRQPDFPSVREDKELFFNKELSVSPLGKEYVRRLVGLLLPHQNFYDNKVILLGHYFISPIADNAILHYAYFMKDSDVVQGRKIYTIGFLPLRRNDFV